MSEIIFENIQPGEAFDLPPALGSKLISKLLTEGIPFYIAGNTIIIEGGEEETPSAPFPEPEPVVEAEVDVPVPVDVDGDLLPDVEVSVAVEVTAEDVQDVAAVEVEAPKPPARRGRKPKAVVEESTEPTE